MMFFNKSCYKTKTDQNKPKPARNKSDNICIWHRWEGEMSSSQHKSPHQARAFRRGLILVTSAEIAHLAVPNDAVCIFSYEHLFETVKSNSVVKRKEDGLISPYVSW